MSNEINKILVDTENVEQIKFTKMFLSYIRSEYDQYRETTRFQHQAFNNVICLLSERVARIEKEKIMKQIDKYINEK